MDVIIKQQRRIHRKRNQFKDEKQMDFKMASKLDGPSVTIGSNERLIVNKVKNLRIPQKTGNLFDLLGNY